LLGETVLIIATVCERPGMVGEPRIGVAEPSALARGVWVEFGMRGLTYRVWVPFVDEGKTVCVPLKQLALPLPQT
jgi:hypothetical protein